MLNLVLLSRFECCVWIYVPLLLVSERVLCDSNRNRFGMNELLS